MELEDRERVFRWHNVEKRRYGHVHSEGVLMNQQWPIFLVLFGHWIAEAPGLWWGVRMVDYEDL